MPWHLPPRVRSRSATLEQLQETWEKPPDQLTYKECWIRIVQLFETRLESGQRALDNRQLQDLSAYCMAWPGYPPKTPDLTGRLPKDIWKAPEVLTDKLREALWAYWPVKDLEPVEF
jgi:hypothetical protein